MDTAPSDLATQARARLSDAVRSHLVSDVPLGVFLSGGLDSAAVAALAREQGQTKAFTVTFPDQPQMDEADLARATARRLGLDHHECEVRAEEAKAWLAEALDAQDQPSMDGYNAFIVSRAVHAAGATVALSGQGGDEVFGGYRSFRDVPRWYRQMAALRWVPTPVRRWAAGLRAWRHGATGRAKAADAAATGADLVGLYLQFRRLFSDAELDAFGLAQQRKRLGPHVQPDAPPPFDGSDHVDAIGRLELHYYLRNTLLRDGDVCGMANSLEIRVPLLDRELVEWVFRLPGHVRLPDNGPTKPLLRQALPEIYDPMVSQAAKRGFVLPLDAWLRGPLRHLVGPALQEIEKRKVLRPQAVARIVQRFEREPGTAAWSRLWALVCLGHWLRRQAPLEVAA